MTPADVYGAVYDAAPALRLWLAVHRPAFDAAVRRAVAETQRDGYVQRGGSMTIAEREQKIDALLRAHPEWSLSKIAREAGVATTTVISVRERLARGMGRSQMDPTQKVGPQRREASARYWRARLDE